MFFNDGRLGDNHVLEAIVNMKEPKGSDKAAIASYIEVFLLHLCYKRLTFPAFVGHFLMAPFLGIGLYVDLDRK